MRQRCAMAKMLAWLFVPCVDAAFAFAPQVHIQQQIGMRFLDAYESGNDYKAVTRPQQGGAQASTQAWVLKKVGYEEYTIQQNSSMRYLDAYTWDFWGNYYVVTRTRQGDDSQVWKLTHVKGDYYKIQQKESMRYLDAYEDSNDYSAVTRTRQSGQQEQTQTWFISPAIPCHVAPKPVGEWKNTFKFSNGHQTFTMTHGTSRSYSSSVDTTWASEVTTTVSAGFKPFGIGADVSVSASISKSLSMSQSETFSTEKSESYSVTFYQAGTIWQWVWTVKDVCGTSTAYAEVFVITNDALTKPCCLPGYFKNASDIRSECLPGSPRDPSCSADAVV